VSSTFANELVPAVLTVPSGGPATALLPLLRPQGDTSGRRLGRPLASSATRSETRQCSSPQRASRAYFFYEGPAGGHDVLCSTPSGWNVNAPSWRVIAQGSRMKWVDTGGVSPALALEQRSGTGIMTNFGGPTSGRCRRPRAAGSTSPSTSPYSGSAANGRVKVYADTNNDGTYEYSSNTLVRADPRPEERTGVESAYINGFTRVSAATPSTRPTFPSGVGT